MAIPDVSGSWKAIQGNGYEVDFEIEQNGGELTGSAWWADGATVIAFEGLYRDEAATARSMEARGTVNEEEFVFNVSWDNGTRGLYTGRFQGDGRLTGLTVDQQHPESQATWISDKFFEVPAADTAEPVTHTPPSSEPLDPNDPAVLGAQDSVILDRDKK
jgi:hypothetical protein